MAAVKNKGKTTGIYQSVFNQTELDIARNTWNLQGRAQAVTYFPDIFDVDEPWR